MSTKSPLPRIASQPEPSLAGSGMDRYLPNQRGALALLILVELLTFSVMSQTIVFPAIVALFVFWGWQRPLRYRLSPDRQVIVSLLIGLLFVAGWRISPHMQSNQTMNYLSPFLHSLGQYLLVLQTGALYLWHEDDILPMTLPWPGVFVMVSAGDINASPSEQNLFQALSIAFIVATALYFSATMRRAAGQRVMRRDWGRVIATCLVLLSIGAGAWMGAITLNRYERDLNRIVSEMLTPAMASTGAGFPNRSQLGSISDRKTAQAEAVALRIESTNQPGYWRGKAYHWLTDIAGPRSARITSWSADPPSIATSSDPRWQRPMPADGKQEQLNRFTLARPAGASIEQDFQVWLEPAVAGVYFLPANATTIYSPDEEILHDFRQTKSPDDVLINYQVRTGSLTARDELVRAGRGDPIFSRELLTHIPRAENLAGNDPRIQATAAVIFANCETVRDHIEAVENYFHDNYTYHQGIRVPSNVDPVGWFLIDKPSAHCEFFAQGAALLLRMRGIPTRYVTGFVVNERNDYGDYWLARNEDAHAWCEAWDPARGWQLVEATPGSGIPSPNQASWHRQAWEYFSASLNQFRYHFAQGGWTWLARIIGRFLMTPAGWLILLVILGYIALRVSMILASRKSDTRSARVMELHRLLAHMDQRMGREGWRRDAGETISHFAIRLARAGETDKARWYADYAIARFGEESEDHQSHAPQIADLHQRMIALRGQRRTQAAIHEVALH